MARANGNKTVKTTGKIEPQVHHKSSSEPMYFAFVVWGAVISAILYFLGYAYLTFFNREFGIEMEDLSYYEVLLKSYNVIKILDPKFLAYIVLLGSAIFTFVLVLRNENGILTKIIKKTGGWVLLAIVPVGALLLSAGMWFFFRDSFMTAREAGILYARYMKTHLTEQSRITFIFDPIVGKTMPLFVMESNAKRELRLVERSKLSYYVMRAPEKGFDPLVYEIPRAKVVMAVIDK